MEFESDVYKEVLSAIVAHNEFLVAPTILIVAGLGWVVWIEDASVERFAPVLLHIRKRFEVLHRIIDTNSGWTLTPARKQLMVLLSER